MDWLVTRHTARSHGATPGLPHNALKRLRLRRTPGEAGERVTFETNPRKPKRFRRTPLAPPGGNDRRRKSLFFGTSANCVPDGGCSFICCSSDSSLRQVRLPRAPCICRKLRVRKSPQHPCSSKKRRRIGRSARGSHGRWGCSKVRPFGVYGLPGAAAFGARFWQGVVWGLGMITVMIFPDSALSGGFSI